MVRWDDVKESVWP